MINFLLACALTAFLVYAIPAIFMVGFIETRKQR